MPIEKSVLGIPLKPERWINFVGSSSLGPQLVSCLFRFGLVSSFCSFQCIELNAFVKVRLKFCMLSECFNTDESLIWSSCIHVSAYATPEFLDAEFEHVGPSASLASHSSSRIFKKLFLQASWHFLHR